MKHNILFITGQAHDVVDTHNSSTPRRTRPARTLWRMAVSLAAALTLAACNSGGGTARTAQRQPTATPTPISQPLPTIATQVPFGTESRPYRVVLVAQSSGTQALSDLLNDQTGRAFEVESVPTNAQGMNLLCGEVPTLLVTDGLTLLAAQGQGCGQPVLLIQRGRGAQALTGHRSEIVVPTAARITNVNGLKGQTFCRLGDQDVATWILPVLMLRAAGGFDPFLDFESVRDVPNIATLIREVAQEQCVGAIPAGALDTARVPGIPSIQNVVAVLPGMASPELPFGGVIASERMPQAVVDQVTRAFLAKPDAVTGLLDGDGLVEADLDALSAISRLLQNAGMNALGQ